MTKSKSNNKIVKMEVKNIEKKFSPIGPKLRCTNLLSILSIVIIVVVVDDDNKNEWKSKLRKLERKINK